MKVVVTVSFLQTESGNPTVIHCGTNIAIGTSTGFVHVFGSLQHMKY